MRFGGYDATLAVRRATRGWAAQQSIFIYRLGYVLLIPFWRYWTGGLFTTRMENIPDRGGGFLIVNHTTFMDPCIIAWSIKNRVLLGPGKTELFAHPFGAWIMRKIGIFPLRRGVVDAAAARTMIEAVRNGRIVVVFPEGTRSEDGELLPFMPEFARLALRLRVPVLPSAVAGGADLMSRETHFPRRGTPIGFAVGPALDLRAYQGPPITTENVEAATDLMHQCVSRELARARGLIGRV